MWTKGGNISRDHVEELSRMETWHVGLSSKPFTDEAWKSLLFFSPNATFVIAIEWKSKFLKHRTLSDKPGKRRRQEKWDLSYK